MGTAIAFAQPMKLAAFSLTLIMSGVGAVSPAGARPADGDLVEKSSALALGLSLIGTGAAVGAIFASSYVDHGEYLGAAGIASLVVGPSLGHFYAGESSRGTRHAAIRLGGAATMGAGLLLALSSPCAFGPENHDDCAVDAGFGLFVVGATVTAGSAIYSIVDAPRAARRASQPGRSVVLMPVPVVGADQATGFGVALSGML